MKLLLLLLALPMIGFAQNVNIPDANFKKDLVGNSAINTNGDLEIQVSEASVFNGAINCSSKNIADLTGIEAFTALTTLWCMNNLFTSLNLSKNTALTELNCYKNPLTSLDVSKNLALRYLYCWGNQLTSLNISGASHLTRLDCSDNQLTSLNISGAYGLISLSCSDNQLTSLDVSKNLALKKLSCFGNKFDCDAIIRRYGLRDD